MKLKQKLAIGYMRARIRSLSLVSINKAAEKAMKVFCTPYGRAGRESSPIFAEGEPLAFRLDGLQIRGHRWAAGPGGGVGHGAGGRDEAGTAAAGNWVGDGEVTSEATDGLETKRALIAHGYQSYSGNFEQYVRALVLAGYEVLAFDAPAHGQSEGRQITLPQYMRMLAEIRVRYGPIDAYIGHSFGGLALTLMLAEMPPDPGARLTLIAPACRVRPYVDYFFQLMRLNGSLRVAFDALGQRLTGGKDWDWFSVRRALPYLSMPVFWVQDEDDTVTPLADALQVKADEHPFIEWMITRGLGHRRIYRDPAVEARVLEFFAGR